MFSRIRIVPGLALLLTILIFTTVDAKGNFSFITVQGPDMKAPVRVTDPALTTDWFAFADFPRGTVDAPTSPGAAYEITRYYIDHNREQAFDRLHYYSDTGFVYYDGIVGGWSEYDGKWYAAQPGIEVTFKNALVKALQARPVKVANQNAGALQTATNAAQSIAPFAITAGLAIILILAFWLHKPSAH